MNRLLWPFVLAALFVSSWTAVTVFVDRWEEASARPCADTLPARPGVFPAASVSGTSTASIHAPKR